ncbi:P-type conjugative transfer protein TrbL, partial [Pigmentiphaga sp.]|uniref:P-type conjugative transfer protein TrbL n=1 Tax=Pigmentiphaga sp. TaxID=1977564 RepID=UPI0025F3E6F5
MDDIAVIDRFLDVFSRYIDSGFGLLGGEVRFLTATLVVIDVTIAGLFWAMSHASGQGDDIIAKLIKKVLYVGAFAYIIGNFNSLAGIVFRSFAGLGLTASGSAMSQAELLQPGRLAQVGVNAGRPIMEQISQLTGFPEVFANLDTLAVLVLAWLVLIVSFFVLAVQLFITLIEFKLTTLAGFVLVPFALWNKTSFLAEKVLGNVVSSGIKVLVLAVVVGIGSTLFSEFQTPPSAEPSIDHALVIMLAALAMFGLGIFGPGIATGLVSGAPQLGAGAAAGTAMGAAGLAIGAGALAVGAGGAVAAGARMAPGAARMAVGAAQGAKSAYGAGAAASGAGGLKGVGAGMANVASAAGQKVAAGARSVRDRVAASVSPGASAAASPSSGASGGAEGPQAAGQQPAWAKRLHQRQQLSHAASTVAHTLRGGDGGGSGS